MFDENGNTKVSVLLNAERYHSSGSYFLKSIILFVAGF